MKRDDYIKALNLEPHQEGVGSGKFMPVISSFMMKIVKQSAFIILPSIFCLMTQVAPTFTV